uniref:Zinc finger protein 292a n=1 Tax=Sinocyclocheilus rhinocerous TaxID=307959 RepID=A0A673HKP6_9TELE
MWPFDPEFWDWKTLKRQCLALMGQEAAAILSTNKFTDSEDNEVHDPDEKYFKYLHFTHSPTDELSEVEAERKTKREMKKMREGGFVSARFRNWQAYMQYCVLCDKEFLGHRIVKHALKHVQDGIFRCPICTETFETRAILEPHVASHVKQSCKERLAAMGVSKKRTICNNIYDSKGSPITNKVFKYFRNLVAHVKAHKNEQEATHFLEIQSQKPMCQYCHRQFVNVTHLNDHLQMHCDEKPYFCIQLGCNCSFSSHAELLIHRKEHAEFKAQCAYPNCERIFIETYLLYDHEAQHYMSFSCKSHNCDKVFYTLSELDLHQKGHKNPSSTFSNHDSMQSTSAKFCSHLENSATSPNQAVLIQLPITQTWETPSLENLDSGFSVHDPYRSTILSDNQHTNPSYHSDTVLDFASPSSYNDIISHSVNAHTPSSVMNEASKYVSSSLRVLHALNCDQTCDLSQVDSKIEKALQRLDLVDILSQDKCVSESTNLHDLSSEAGTRNDQCHTIKDSVQNEQKCILKPFRCKEDCVYGAMTKEALFKHLSRVHDYSEDRINEMKKNPDKLAPYNCHLCSKAFTRTTGLKIHYKNVHHFSKEELSGLKIGLGYRKIRKSTENAHTGLIIDQGNDSLSEQSQSQINTNLTVISVDSNVKGKASIVAKRKNKCSTQNSLTVASTDTSKMPVDNIDFGDSSDAQIMYRPYRCVHEGCVAAFSIQQNLILHYRAMHQSECDDKNSAKETDGVVQVQEYRCQVKQCSKVVLKVTSLLKHYLLLHRCTLEKASVSADGDFESVDLTFRCQFEGCDRVYTTKSNLLRHLMKKHDATFETMKEKQENWIGDDVQAKKLSAGSNNGKENIANNNIKMKRKNSKKREDKAQNHWMTKEKPALKSTDEASAMCNERLPLQYPCMIESCDSVMSAEHSIIKHYTTHGLTERYIEDRRSQFIFCKKSNDMPRADSTSKNVEVEETVFDGDQTENSKVSSQDVSPEPATEVRVNEGFTSTTMPVIKRKRGRPRKSECRNKISVERKQSLRNCSGEHVKCMLKVSGSILNSSNSQGNHVDNEVALKLYKPSEFETSVRKFDEDSLSNPTKRQRTLQPIIQERDQVQCIVNFRNPLKIETVKNVKIVMYENLSTCSELLLRQLQDMQPMVILKRGLHS